MDFFGRHKRETGLEVKAHLVTEGAYRAHTRPVMFLFAVLQNMLKKPEVLLHFNRNNTSDGEFFKKRLDRSSRDIIRRMALTNLRYCAEDNLGGSGNPLPSVGKFSFSLSFMLADIEL
jgi:hypothetical protein